MNNRLLRVNEDCKTLATCISNLAKIPYDKKTSEKISSLLEIFRKEELYLKKPEDRELYMAGKIIGRMEFALAVCSRSMENHKQQSEETFISTECYSEEHGECNGFCICPCHW